MTENDAFKGSLKVLDLFEEGRKFTLDLLKENERLRLVIAGLRNEDHDAGVPAAATTDRRVGGKQQREPRRMLQRVRAGDPPLVLPQPLARDTLRARHGVPRRHPGGGLLRPV